MQLWSIKGSHGLYVGTASSRHLAIAQHVWAYDRDCFDKGFPFYQSPPLSQAQKRAWKECRERGDEAVKVTVKEMQ